MRQLAKQNRRSIDAEGNMAVERHLAASRKALKEGKKLPGANEPK